MIGEGGLYEGNDGEKRRKKLKLFSPHHHFHPSIIFFFFVFFFSLSHDKGFSPAAVPSQIESLVINGRLSGETGDR